MAANNLIIHTGNSFELPEIHYVYFLYLKDPVWKDVSESVLDDTSTRRLFYREESSTEEISSWIYKIKEGGENNYKFNVIALYKETNNDLIDPTTGKLKEDIDLASSSKQLLAFGHYKAYQSLELSEEWIINISSSWRFSDALTTDATTEFELLYNEHTIATNPTEGLTPVHSRLIDSYAVPATKIVNNIVANYQNRGIRNEGTGEEDIDSIYGLNIVKYVPSTENPNNRELIVALNKAEKSAQWLVIDKLGPGYEDVLCLYEDPSAVEIKNYITKRITKYNYETKEV